MAPLKTRVTVAALLDDKGKGGSELLSDELYAIWLGAMARKLREVR